MSFKFLEGGVEELMEYTGCNSVYIPAGGFEYLIYVSNEPYMLNFYDHTNSDPRKNSVGVIMSIEKNNYLAIRNPNYINMEKYISEYKHLIGCEYRVENCNREYFITEQHTNIHWKHNKPALWDSKIKFFTEDDELVTYEEYMELYYPEYRHVWEKQL